MHLKLLRLLACACLVAALRHHGGGVLGQEPVSIPVPYQAGHVLDVTFVEWTDDSRVVVSYSAGDRRACLWEASTGALLVGQTIGSDLPEITVPGRSDLTLIPERGVTGLALRYPASGGTVWDLQIMRVRAESPDHKLEAIVSLPDTRHIIEIRDRATQRLVSRLEGHPGIVAALEFSPDGTSLVSANGDGTVTYRDSTSGRLESRLIAAVGSLTSLALSTDGHYVAAAASVDAGVRVWDAVTGALIHVLRGHREEWPVNALAFVPKSDLLASGGGNGDRSVRLWNLRSGAPAGVIEIPGERRDAWTRICCGSAVASLAAAPSGRQVLVTTIDGYLYSLDPAMRRLVEIRPGWSFSTGTVAAVRFHDDGWDWIVAGRERLRLASGTDRAVQLAWQPTGRDAVWAAAIERHGRFAAFATVEGHVYAFDLSSGRELGHWRSSDPADPGFNAVAIDPSGRYVAAGGDDQNIQVWNVETGVLVWSLDKVQ